MISLAEAQARVFAGIETLPTRRLATAEALGLSTRSVEREWRFYADQPTTP